MDDPTKEAQKMIREAEQQALKDSKARNKSAHLESLLDFVCGWKKRSEDWRQASYEDKWQSYRRMADGVYEPRLSDKKKAWQSKAFIPIVPSHRETIQAALYRTMMGPQPKMEMKARPTIPPEADQSENIRDLILREEEKSGFETEFNKVLGDATTYGSGFARVRYEVRVENRRIRSAEPGPLDPSNLSELIASFQGTRKARRYREEVVPTEVFRGVKFEWLSIWDIYPDPDKTDIKDSSIAYRFYSTQGRIKQLVEEGMYLPQAYSTLIGETDVDRDEEEDTERRADRGEADPTDEPPVHGKEVRCYEYYGKLPRKWVFPGEVKDGDPDELVCARVLFHEKAIMSVEPNMSYDGQAPIYKLDYLPVNQQFYGRGIPEMLAHLQEVVNETVNQRIDNVSLVMNRMFAVVDRAVLNRNDLESRPGGFIRVSHKALQEGASVNDVLRPIDTPDVTRSSYADAQEMERYAQERTGANRVTLGTAGQTADTNKTLGGMELLRQSAGEKMGYIGMLMEFQFLREVWKAYWKEIYANIEPEDVINALGEDRAQRFELMPPESIDRDYKYVPMGVFTMENKALRNAQIGNLRAQYADQPWVNHEAMFDEQAKAIDADAEQLKLSPEDTSTMMRTRAQMNGSAGPMDMPMNGSLSDVPQRDEAGPLP